MKLKDYTEAQLLTELSSTLEELWEGDFSYGEIQEAVQWGDGIRIETHGWDLKYVDSYGGEGQGDEYWCVFSVSDGETIRSIQLDGSYSSYGDGGQLDEWFEVFPEQEMVTVWKRA